MPFHHYRRSSTSVRRTLPGPRWLPVLVPAAALFALALTRVALGEQPVSEAAPQAPQAAQATYEQSARPFIQKYCGGCHGPANPKGGVSLTGYADVKALQRDQGAWRKVLEQLREQTMPPRGTPQPKADEREKLVAWLAHTLDTADESLIPKDPGRVLIHRLSRTEYNNTVRDLFGAQSRPADKFPADGGGGGGFDNNADTLFIPPILMERYLEAAGEVLNEAPAARLFFVRPGKTLPAREAARRILAHFATRAFRRPVETAETARLLSLYDQAAKRGEPFEGSVKFALKAVLVSPHFLFRVEKDRPGTEPYLIGDYELASRLSYFLWASMPDDELFKLAGQKRLRDPQVLDAQIRRMIQSPKSAALADSFAGQWLRVRDLYTAAQPDPRRYPGYTPSLRDAMYRETVEFFSSLLREGASLLHLLDADYTFLNEELAKHYGIEGVKGPEFRKVALGDRRRGGILTMAGVLTVTSYPQRTSPVLRGKWVLEEVLGTRVPPPPPNAGGLPAEDAPKEGLTFRQRLEKHREKPECSSCHSRMDAVGFGLENFDAVGRWRAELGGQPVDATGVLTTGEKFTGPEELKQYILRSRKQEFARNVAEKMLAYALGRGLEPYDIPTVRRITAALEKDGYRASTLVREIVKSYPFQYRKNG
jgi:mono/diheme cytochrome c family protein